MAFRSLFFCSLLILLTYQNPLNMSNIGILILEWVLELYIMLKLQDFGGVLRLVPKTVVFDTDVTERRGRDCMKTLDNLKLKAFRAPKRGKTGRFLPRCTTKTTPQTLLERLFIQSRKMNSRKSVCTILREPEQAEQDPSRGCHHTPARNNKLDTTDRLGNKYC